MNRRDLVSAMVGAAIATVLAGGIAWAAIPGAGGAINGCYQKVEGQLRVIDPGTDRCRPSEVAISWNEQGVQGEKGDKGDPGAPGRDGRDGADVTVASEPPGANCPAGGLKLTATSGLAWVCSGSQGEPDPGPD